MEGNVRGKTAPLPKKAVSLLYNNSLFPLQRDYDLVHAGKKY